MQLYQEGFIGKDQPLVLSFFHQDIIRRGKTAKGENDENYTCS